jgi:hypothetical protein
MFIPAGAGTQRQAVPVRACLKNSHCEALFAEAIFS